MALSASAWGPTRFPVGSVAAPTHTETAAVPSPSGQEAAALKAFSLENPLMVGAALVGVTIGLVAFSTSVRVGSVRAGLTAGKS